MDKSGSGIFTGENYERELNTGLNLKGLERTKFSRDFLKARSVFILNLQIGGVITRNPQWIKHHYGEDLFSMGLNKIQMLKISNFEVFQNAFSLRLSDCLALDSNKTVLKLPMVLPTTILVKTSTYLQ